MSLESAEPLSVQELLRPVLLVSVVLLIPVLPFLAFGSQMESWTEQWLDQRPLNALTAALVVVLLATDIFLPVPSSLISTWSGGHLHWHLGTLASWSGMSAGAVIGFLVARRWGRGVALWFATEADLLRMQRLSHQYGPWVLVLTRPLPVLAEASVLFMGLNQLGWRRFLAPVLLSNLGIALAYSVFGGYAAERQWLPLALAVSLALPLLLTLLVKSCVGFR